MRVQPAEAARSPAGGSSLRFGAADNPLRTYGPLHVLLIALTWVTGLLDAVTYLDFGHVFAANMTGNFILLGISVLGVESLSATASLAAVAGFLIGVGAGGHLARWLQPRGQRWVIVSVCTALGLLLAALLATAYRPVLGDYPPLALLASGMGVINATANRIGIPGLTTTLVITTTLTNLTSGVQVPGGDTRKRMRQLSAVAAIVLGAIVGGALVLRFGAVIAIGTGAAVVLVATGTYVFTLPGTRSLLNGRAAAQ